MNKTRIASEIKRLAKIHLKGAEYPVGRKMKRYARKAGILKVGGVQND